MIEKSLWRVVLEKQVRFEVFHLLSGRAAQLAWSLLSNAQLHFEQIRTVDLGGTYGTQEVVGAVIAEIEHEMQMKKTSSA